MTKIKFLIVDDNPDDRTLAKRELNREFKETQIIEVLNFEQFEESLAHKNFDFVITDYQLRWSNGLKILKMLKQEYPNCPVIMFTGTGSEEIAVEAMKEGLDDYVIKSPQHYLRLAKAVRSVYERYQKSKALQEVESKYLRLFENVPVGLYRINQEGQFLEANIALISILGYQSKEEIKQANLFNNHFQSQDLADIKNKIKQEQATHNLEILLYCCDKSQIWVRYSGRSVYDENQNFLYYEGAIEDITQRKQAEAQISQLLVQERKARKEAEVANRLKDDFLATLSHELRTPLNSIVGWAKMLELGKLSSERVTEAIKVINRNARSLTKLIEDLLDVSLIIRGQMKLNLRPVDLDEIVNSAIKIAIPAAEAKSIELHPPQPKPNIVAINGEPERLHQIVWNLLINAIKFTPQGGKVTVELERIDDMIAIEVTDTGIGLESETIPYLFERFRQGDSSFSRSYGGLGLGLAIVRHFSELHGGTVEAFSAGKNQGSTFRVNLPIPVALASPKKLENLNSFSHLPQLAEFNILLVDDELDSLQLISVILEECKAKVTAVSSVKAALEKLKTNYFDLLISDICMPEADGYSLIDFVRSNFPQLKSIAMTAYASKSDRDSLLNAGFCAYIAKPINLDLFIKTVRDLLIDSSK